MKTPAIETVSLTALDLSSPFEGELALAETADLAKIFSRQNALKTKFYTILIVEKGSGSLMIDQQIKELKKHRIFFGSYHQIFRFREVENFKGKAILFTRSFYNFIFTGNAKIKNDTAFLNLPNFSDFNPKEFLNLMVNVADIQREYAGPGILSKEMICLYLKILMLKYRRNIKDFDHLSFRSHHKSSYVERFKNLVDRHFKDEKRTRFYSEQLAISANYLNSLIQEKLESSAEEFIQHRVVLEAERLLLNTDLSVTEISFELGFSDNSHFGKYFKKINGESPNQFRRSSGPAHQSFT